MVQCKPTQIVIHHSAEQEPTPQFSAIDQWHKVRDFPQSSSGHFVGYHYVLERDGLVVQARPDTEVGAHVAGQNSVSIGVCLVGNFDIEDPTVEQVESLGGLLVELVQRYGLSASHIVPHRVHNTNTHCYGLRLHDKWAQQVFIDHRR